MSDREIARFIKKAIDNAYEAGEIQTFEDFNTIFLATWNSYRIKSSRLRGAILQVVKGGNYIVAELRKRAAEAYRPIAYDSRVEHLPITLRTHNCLVRQGLRTVGDIISFLETEKDLIALRGIGQRSVGEIYDALRWAKIEIPGQPEFSGENPEATGAQKSEKSKYPTSPLVPGDDIILLKDGETIRKEFSARGDKKNGTVSVAFDGQTLYFVLGARKITIEAEG